MTERERKAKGGLWWTDPMLFNDPIEFAAQRAAEELRMRREELPASVKRFFEEKDEQAIWEERLREEMAREADEADSI